MADVVPTGIGLRETCVYWLHTHATSGLIHVEAPEEQPFTLGQFFAIWGRELDSTRIGDQVAATGEGVHAFVDGAPWTGEPRDLLSGQDVLPAHAWMIHRQTPKTPEG